MATPSNISTETASSRSLGDALLDSQFSPVKARAAQAAAALVIQPTGGLFATSVADSAARIVDLNDYATTTHSAADGAVNGLIFSSATAFFNQNDVGKNILIRGAGAAGVSFQTTIAAFLNSTSVMLTAAAPTTVAGALFWWGADATPGVQIAYARARTLGLAIRGRGAFWLASQATTILLSGVSTSGDGGPTQCFSPFTGSGLVFMITSTACAPFNPGTGAHFQAAVFYPAQDGSAIAPVIYPAVFSVPNGGLITNFTLTGSTFVNPYRLLTVTAGAGAGRIFVTDTRVYAIDRVFDINNGMADVLMLDATCYFGCGVFPESTTGNQYLRKYTAISGEVIHLDPNAAGSNYPNMDGLLITGGIWQGYRYGIRIVSGQLDVSNVTNLNLDSTPTAVSVEGTASADLNWSGGEIYSSQNFAPTAFNDVFSISVPAPTVRLSLNGVHIPYAQGNIVRDQAVGLRRLTMTACDIEAWGQTTTLGSTYFVVSIANNSVVRLTLTGNGMDAAAPAVGNSISGVFTGNVAGGSIVGNTITSCATPFSITGSVGSMTLIGNTTIGTYGAKSLATVLSGSATLIGGSTMNNFDKP